MALQLDEHTPTPWYAGVAYDDGNGCFDVTVGPFEKDDHYEDTICRVSGENHDAELNAAFIVKAVNAHDELVAALRRIADFDRDVTGGPEMAAIAREALTKAQPE